MQEVGGRNRGTEDRNSIVCGDKNVDVLGE